MPTACWKHEAVLVPTYNTTTSLFTGPRHAQVSNCYKTSGQLVSRSSLFMEHCEHSRIKIPFVISGSCCDSSLASAKKKRTKTATSVCMRLCLAELNCGRRQRDLLVLSIRQSWSVRRESSCINWSHNEFEHPIAFMKDAGRSDSFSGLNGKYGGNFIVPLLTFLTR